MAKDDFLPDGYGVVNDGGHPRTDRSVRSQKSSKRIEQVPVKQEENDEEESSK